jgi:hypothetical protein
MAPCKAAINSSFSVDTSVLVEGDHTVEVSVEDGSGQLISSPFSITVHNRPTNSGRPALSGISKIGEALAASTGQWEGAPSSFSYQWLRCPLSAKVDEEAACAPVAGANQDNHLLVEADVGMRLVAKVTATNSFGSTSALSVPSEAVADRFGSRPPETKIDKHPRKKTVLRIARFRFGSDQPDARFECKLDRGPFKACRPPLKRKVKPGRHDFQVRAVSAAGIADPTPAAFRWRVS